MPEEAIAQEFVGIVVGRNVVDADSPLPVTSTGPDGGAVPTTGEATFGTADDNTDVVVDATAGGVTVLAANASRASALITNTGAAPMRVTLDGSAPTATHGIPVEAGGRLVLGQPFCPTGAVKALRSTATSTTANASEVVPA